MLQEEEKAVVASSSRAASRFAYDVLANEDEAAKGAGVVRGKDGHVQLGGAGDDFFSKPLAKGPSGGRGSAAKCAPSPARQLTLHFSSAPDSKTPNHPEALIHHDGNGACEPDRRWGHRIVRMLVPRHVRAARLTGLALLPVLQGRRGAGAAGRRRQGRR